jgi:hypothetical protein
MSRFLIELRHDAEERACARYVKVILQSGSHFLVQADWGCMDGEHSAWIIVEADSKDEARCIVPPALRAQAKIVALNNFTLEQMEAILR